MSSVTFSTSVGGDGSTVTDDNNATTGLREGGWKTRFVPSLTQEVAVAAYVVNAALTVLGGATTNSTSLTSLAIGTGSKSLTLAESGKAYIIGQYVIIASTASPANSMAGQITSFSGTSLVVNVTKINGSGTIASWSISVSSDPSGVSLSTANTWTATQTFNGTSSTLGTVLLDSAETVNIVAAAPSATTNLYVQSGSVQYYTSNAANNFIVNLAFSSGTSMNTAMTTGQSVTAALITTQNTTAYYNTAVQVDGTGTGVTTRWIGGAPIAGNASGLDTYRFAVIKTGSATYTVLASLTQYKA